LLALDAEWEKATEGKRTSRRSIVTRDRNDPTRHLVIVFFDSYDSAMENSELPETKTLATRFGEFVSAPLTFHDLDVIEDKP
jgi:hypothetical protein